MKITLISIVVGITFVITYILVYRSVSKLKRAIIAYYDFSFFIPASGSWTVIFYIIIVITLILFSYLMLTDEVSFLIHA